ncbi:hypothetical protein QBC37DRAFT_456815 [Rhypophila decipiens]|uniref:Fucose-specific lectin n=1 Tax=Rhypophila decipiens TaxID=261697 RepID=A0AAN7B114_9PEZI|nr:hypothetical protein QBC37DRAFT_456815 [Rhypophila decipiens]
MASLSLGGKGGNMSLHAKLKDGTTINVTVSSPHGATPEITASTSTLQDSLSINICSSHSHPTHSIDSHQLPHSKMSAVKLPTDIVAVESGGIGYLFYVNAANQLAYMREQKPDANDASDDEFAVGKILDDQDEPFEVDPNVKQIAAISWVSNGTREIRVYYQAARDDVNNKDPRLCEVCLTNTSRDVYAEDAKWYAGDFGVKGNSSQVRPGSSMSATVRKSGNDVVGLRVYASKEGDKNQYNSPTIAVFKYDFQLKKWGQGDSITSKIRKF